MEKAAAEEEEGEEVTAAEEEGEEVAVEAVWKARRGLICLGKVERMVEEAVRRVVVW